MSTVVIAILTSSSTNFFGNAGEPIGIVAGAALFATERQNIRPGYGVPCPLTLKQNRSRPRNELLVPIRSVASYNVRLRNSDPKKHSRLDIKQFGRLGAGSKLCANTIACFASFQNWIVLRGLMHYTYYGLKSL